MEMTENDKKKRYLFGYRDALRKQKVIEEEIRELRLNRMLPSLTQDGMPHGSGGSDMSGYAAKLDELLRDLDEQAQHCIDIRREIAVEMGYEFRHITRIHGRGLEHFKMS